MHLDGSNAENKISLLVILCIIMYVKQKKSKPIYFFYKTDYGKMLKYREKYRSISSYFSALHHIAGYVTRCSSQPGHHDYK